MNHTRHATIDDLKLVIRSLNDNKVEYFLIGGYALFAHGFYRATHDIDLLVPANRETGEKIRNALMILPDRAAEEIDLSWFANGENIRVADAYSVDILFNACGETYESLRQFASTVMIDDIPVRTVNLEGLLLTKQSAREKDKLDRAMLILGLEYLETRARG